MRARKLLNNAPLTALIVALTVPAYSSREGIPAPSPEILERELEKVCGVNERDFQEKKLDNLMLAINFWTKFRIAYQTPLLTPSEISYIADQKLSQAKAILNEVPPGPTLQEVPSASHTSSPGFWNSIKNSFRQATSPASDLPIIRQNTSNTIRHTRQLNDAVFQARSLQVEALSSLAFNDLNSTLPSAVCLDKIVTNRKIAEKYFNDIAVFADGNRKSPIIALARIAEHAGKRRLSSNILVSIGADDGIYAIRNLDSDVEVVRFDNKTHEKELVPKEEMRFWSHAIREIRQGMNL